MATNDDLKAHKFYDRVRSELKSSEHDLDSEIVQRLDAARREAVEIATQKSGVVWRTPMVWGLSGSAAAAVLAFALFVPPLLSPGDDKLPPLDQPEFVVAQEAELLEELEFVAWMVAMEDMEESGEVDVSS